MTKFLQEKGRRLVKHISISGAVAAGKSTMLGRIMARLGDRAVAHEERPQDNPFIRSYYADSRRWSFHSQMTFLALYFDSQAWRAEDKEYCIFDRCLIENLVLARYRLNEGDLTAEEFAVIEKMARGIESLMPPVDKYIFLDCSVELLTRRLRERGRDYEGTLGEEYARKLKALYDQWIATLPQDRLLIIHQDEGEADMDKVMRFIES